jgi:predicted nuclease with TOPRIM domain
MVSDTAKPETVIVNEVRQSIVRLGERALTGRTLQTAIWKIWGHCRENQNSLDSERHCKIIEEIVQQAVVSVQKRVEDLAAELDAAQAEVRELRKQVKRLSVSVPSAA